MMAVPPDLILADGRLRVACVLQALLASENNPIIAVHDFWDRPRYHGVLTFTEPVDRADTLVLLRRRAEVDDWKLTKALQAALEDWW